MKSFGNHIDHEKEEQLKWEKTEVEIKLKKILKVAKGINGNKDGISKKKSEIINLIEDFHQHYESLYSLYEDLRGEVKNINVNLGDDGSSSSYSSSSSQSDSESYYSPVESTPKSGSETNSYSDNNHDSGTSDVEDTILKDKLTCTSEVKETLASSQSPEFNESLEKKTRVKELEGEDARLKIEIETLKRHWEEQEREAMQMREKKSRSEARLLELEAACKDKEGQLNALNVENRELQRKISHFQTSLSEGEKELSAQEKKLKACEIELSARIKSMNGKVKNLEKKLEELQNERNSLQVESEKLKNDKKRYATEHEDEKQELLVSNSKMERKNTELTNKIEDQQKTLLELGDAITKLKSENEKAQAQSRFLDSEPNFQLVERKIGEMAEDLRKQFEDKYRILSRRIRVAEQLHVENKEWYRKTKETHEQEKKEVQESMGKMKDISVVGNEMLISLDSLALKMEECNANFLNRISKASCDLKFAREWAKRKNKALVHVKNDLDGLLCQLDEKEGEILAYREKVWKSENKTRELEKMMKKKEDGMVGLQEEKREAIRQLCVWIDYHRSRSDYYMKMLFDMNAGRRSHPQPPS